MCKEVFFRFGVSLLRIDSAFLGIFEKTRSTSSMYVALYCSLLFDTNAEEIGSSQLSHFCFVQF
jgi:hypothetical protein